MFTGKFGLEIEFTGITRQKAAETAVGFLGGSIDATGDYYDARKITAPDGRIWKIMYDGSIHCQKKEGRRTISASMDVTLIFSFARYSRIRCFRSG